MLHSVIYALMRIGMRRDRVTGAARVIDAAMASANQADRPVSENDPVAVGQDEPRSGRRIGAA
jgi:hypothetical protein